VCLRAYPRLASWAAFLRRSAATLISLDAYRVSKDGNSFYSPCTGEDAAPTWKSPDPAWQDRGGLGYGLL